MPETPPAPQGGIIHVDSAAELRACRALLGRMRNVAQGLRDIGKPGQAAEVDDEAAALAAVTVLVPVTCMLCRKPFWASFPVEGPPGIVIENGVCGPCSAAGEPGAAEIPVIITSE